MFPTFLTKLQNLAALRTLQKCTQDAPYTQFCFMIFCMCGFASAFYICYNLINNEMRTKSEAERMNMREQAEPSWRVITFGLYNYDCMIHLRVVVVGNFCLHANYRNSSSTKKVNLIYEGFFLFYRYFRDEKIFLKF